MRHLRLAVILAIACNGLAQTGPTLTTLHNFTGCCGGGAAPNGVIEGRDGVLYGTTLIGGAEVKGTLPSGDGTLFALTPPAAAGGAWSESVLSFSPELGARPHSGVAIGSNGVLYGVTYHSATVYAAKPPLGPGEAWHTEVIGGGGPMVLYPSCVLAVGPGNVLYGTSYEGGSTFNKVGDVFAMTPPAAPGGSWTLESIYDFNQSSNGDGYYPESGVVIGDGGVLYGTTGYSSPGGGVAYSLTPPATPGGSWTETVLYFFGATPTDALLPGGAGVAIGAGGVLYGTTKYGGTSSACLSGCGAVYSLTPPATPGGAWTEAVLYSFQGGADGWNPNDGVVVSDTGILYGTTTNGGGSAACQGGCGTVFSLTPPATPGGAWTETILHSFNHTDGASPTTVIVGREGGLYGTTAAGGTSACPLIGGCGTVFQLK